MKATKRHLIGRTIVDVDFRPFRAGSDSQSRGIAHNPVLTLDNGRRVFFVTEETEIGEYGTTICVTDKEAKDKT